MTDLAPNQLVVALQGQTACAALERVLLAISGSGNLFHRAGPIGSFDVDLSYSVYDTRVRFQHPLIVFDKLGVDTTFYVRVRVDFNGLYDSIPLPLPPRCWKVCVPFTDWCAEKCIDLGSLSFTVPVPISFNAAGTYRPNIDTRPDEFVVYPEVISITPFLIDPVRIIDRVCHAMADLLPWPLSLIAGSLCNVFASVFGFFEDAIVQALNALVADFFSATGGWVGLKLKGVELYKLERHSFPGTGTASVPLIPAELSNLEANINSADELQVDAIILPAP